MNVTNRIIGSMVKKKDNLIKKITENTGSKGKGKIFGITVEDETKKGELKPNS
jgi:hypothetical protein